MMLCLILTENEALLKGQTLYPVKLKCCFLRDICKVSSSFFRPFTMSCKGRDETVSRFLAKRNLKWLDWIF